MTNNKIQDFFNYIAGMNAIISGRANQDKSLDYMLKSLNFALNEKLKSRYTKNAVKSDNAGKAGQFFIALINIYSNLNTGNLETSVYEFNENLELLDSKLQYLDKTILLPAKNISYMGIYRIKAIMEDIIRKRKLLLDYAGTDMVAQSKIDILSKLHSYGVKILPKDNKLERFVLSSLGFNNQYVYQNCWYVENTKSEIRYEKELEKAKSRNTARINHAKEKILWHGSTNSNWMSILFSGLKIMSEASNGRMFGDGLYFTDVFEKALHYSSSAQNKKIYIAAFKVIIGNSMVLEKGQNVKLYIGDKYDSVKGQRGKLLLNDEYIIYNAAKCKIYALVELFSLKKS